MFEFALERNSFVQTSIFMCSFVQIFIIVATLADYIIIKIKK